MFLSAKKVYNFGLIIVIALAFLTGCAETNQIELDDTTHRPNILVIVADDMGFSDVGAYGGEISTPNIDSLAEQGITMTNFYTASTCSPTRTMLLTGVDHHLVGMGTMNGRVDVNQEGKRGYETYLNEDAVTVSSLLKDNGYHTYITGKWHLGYEPEFQPQSRGFEKSFVLLQGAASHFDDPFGVVRVETPQYMENGEAVTLPEDFYSTNSYTDKIIEYMEEDSSDDKPFFAYLAYTSPHWPLQVPEEDLNLYKGRYDGGYEEIRETRLAKLRDLGLIDEDTNDSNIPFYITNWDSLSPEEKREESRRMEIYAAMVDNLDRNIGRVINYLKETNQYENTFIIFMSDNGAEGNDLIGLADNKEWFVERFDNSVENMGNENSYIFQGAEWARVSTTPFRDFKTFVTEGGIKVPAIVRYKDVPYSGVIDDEIVSVKDITPTILELVGISHPGTTYKGRKVYNMTGKSALSHFKDIESPVHGLDDLHAWEFLGRQAVRKGDWKLVQHAQPYGAGDWELYNLKNDPTETEDLAAQSPEIITQLVQEWEVYKANNNIIMPVNGENVYARPN
ncbi:MAG: sulfatase-like hydrolase/transferase [Emcibacteraceae bacterium]|nr:sulfatase-like hydrolase/transferase [Emcibacteraceae bacterium]